MSLRTSLESFRLNFYHVLLICPAIVLYIYSNSLNLISLQSLVNRRICLFTYNQTVCDNLKNYTHYADDIQQMSSQTMIYLDVCFLVPAILSILFMASVGDRRLDYERPLHVSIAGSLLQSFVCIFASLADMDHTASLSLLYAAQFVNGLLGGGSLCFISSCFSHISMMHVNNNNNQNDNGEDSKKQQQNRSIKYSICEAFILIGQFLGSLTSGYLIGNRRDLKNFTRVFIVSFSLFLLVLIYTFLMFRHLKRQQQQTMSINPTALLNEEEDDESTTDSEQRVAVVNVNDKKHSLLASFKILVIQSLAENWHLLKRKRANNGRFQILSFFVLYFFGASISLGIMRIEYFYLIEAPIDFKQTDYGLFKALNTLMRSISLLLILPLLKRRLKMPDYYLYTIGLTSEFLNLVIFTLAHFNRNLIWTGIIKCLIIFANQILYEFI